VTRIPKAAGGLTIRAATAAELMTTDPVTVRHDDSVQVAATLMREGGISALPVVDHFGHAVGVVSQFDIIARHPRLVRRLGRPQVGPAKEAESGGGPEPDGVPVAEFMTSAVFTVAADTPVRDVIDKLVSLRVHRLFVRDLVGRLVGVVSMTDVLRHLA
jgi:CBS domain-containing protein